jgi:hypothetical protein
MNSGSFSLPIAYLVVLQILLFVAKELNWAAAD